MAYSRTHTIDSGPSGDTVKAAIAVKLDGDLTNIFTYLNAHNVATTGVHGLGSGTVCGTTNTQTLENKTIVNPVISGSISNASIVTPTFSGAITSGGATFNGGTFSDVTMTGTITGDNATYLRGTISDVTMTGTITALGAELLSPTILTPTFSGAITSGGATFNGGTFSDVTMTGTITALGATIKSPAITGATITESTLNGITATPQTTGFTIAGGVASKTLTLDTSIKASVVASSFSGYKNLAIDYVSASTATVTADEVCLQNSDGFIKRFTSLSETVDITKSGANGLDTGSEAVSTWYHIWAIGKEDGTLDCLLSLSATAPTMPAGYTYKLYLGAVRNTSGGNFYDFHQRDNRSTVTETLVMDGGGAPLLTAVDLSGCVPATAKKGIVLVEGAISGDGLRVYIASKNSGARGQVYLYNAVSGSQYTGVAGQITQLILEPQTLYYAISGGTCKIFVVGCEF